MLTVNDLMTRDPYTTRPHMSLREVVMIMKVEGLRQLPVIKDDRTLVGIVTDRDVRLVMNSPLVGDQELDHIVLDETTIDQCMTTAVMTVTPTTPAHEAIDMLITYKFGALAVVEGEKLVGIITVTDCLTAFGQSLKKSTASV